MESISLLVINVWSGLDYRGILRMGEYETHERRGERFRHLAAEIERLSPDIAVLNEANPLPFHARTLARALGYEAVSRTAMGGIRVGGAGIPVNLREGDAILARKGMGLRKVGSRRLSGCGFTMGPLSFQASEVTQVLAAKIFAAERRIYIFATHLHASPLDPWASERLGEWVGAGEVTENDARRARRVVESGRERRNSEIERMLSFVSRTLPPGCPCFILGDFNATEDQPEIVRIGESGFTDTYRAAHPDAPGYTWDPRRNTNIAVQVEADARAGARDALARLSVEGHRRRIDYIFMNDAFDPDDVLESRVVLDEPASGQDPPTFPSDHFGVLTRVRLRWRKRHRATHPPPHLR